ncbi:hypothetical protein AgCh_010612 [Apium graveolens]
MSKRKEITSYFQPKKKQTTTCEDEEPSAASIEVTEDGVEPLIFGGINRNSEQNSQNPEIVNEGIDSENTDEIIDFNSLIRDPGLRKQIETYHPNKKDLIRRAYIDLGPYQPVQVYPFSGPENHPRRFQKSWFDKFPWKVWLEYFYCHNLNVQNIRGQRYDGASNMRENRLLATFSVPVSLLGASTKSHHHDPHHDPLLKIERPHEIKPRTLGVVSQSTELPGVCSLLWTDFLAH